MTSYDQTEITLNGHFGLSLTNCFFGEMEKFLCRCQPERVKNQIFALFDHIILANYAEKINHSCYS